MNWPVWLDSDPLAALVFTCGAWTAAILWVGRIMR